MGSLRPVLLALITFCGAAAQTSTINTFAGDNAAGFSGDGGPATSAQLSNPSGVAVDSAGNVYIADAANSRVRIVNTSGVISTFAGNGSATYTGDGSLATVAGLIGPTSVAVDSADNVYIADPPAGVIRKVSNGVISTFAGTGTNSFSGDGGPASAATMDFPSGVAVDTSGNVYIADTLNQRIRKVSGGIITTIAGISNLGYNGDNQSATAASLFAPQGVAVDTAGNVYIADTQNNRVRKVTPAGIITTVAGNGTAGYGGDGGPATAAEIYLPKAVALDPGSNLYIADYGNNIIRRVSNGIITTVAGSNLNGYSGDGGPAIDARLSGPLGVALDPTGAFTYIADSVNNVVRVVTNTVTSGVIPHFAAGGTYVTGLYVINKSNSSQTFAINFYNDAGTQISVPATGGTTTGMTLSDTIPALGTGYYELGVISSSTSVSGSAVIQSSPSILVQGLFRHQGSGSSPYEAAVQSTLGDTEEEIAFDATTYAPTGAQIVTGVAIANIDQSNTATISCVARDNTGTVVPGAVTVPALNPGGHWAAAQFPALVGKRGTIDCTSNTRIGMVSLRAIGTDAISSLPVIMK